MKCTHLFMSSYICFANAFPFKCQLDIYLVALLTVMEQDNYKAANRPLPEPRGTCCSPKLSKVQYSKIPFLSFRPVRETCFFKIKWQWCGSLHVSQWFCNFQGLYGSERFFFNKHVRHGSSKHDNGERLRSTAFLAQQQHDTHNAFIINVNV